MPCKALKDMDGTNYQDKAQNLVQRKFGRKKRMKSRYAPRYPSSAEREYRRINSAYVQILDKTLEKQLPSILKAYEKQMRKDSHEDGVFDFLPFLRKKIHAMADTIAKAMERFRLQEQIGKIGRMVQERSITEWGSALKSTLDIDIPADKYREGAYEQEMQRWISDNYNYVRNIPVDTLLEIENLIADAFRDGVDIDVLEEEIRNRLDKAFNRGQFAAISQVSSLNAYMMKSFQTGAGVKNYVWISCRDDRVRESHRSFDGKTFSWDDPPEDWYRTKERGVVRTGKRYNPGEAPGCRCCAVPVFDKKTFEIPK